MIIDIHDAESNQRPGQSECNGGWAVVHIDQTRPDIEGHPLDSQSLARTRPILVRTIDLATGLIIAAHIETI